MSEFQTRRLDSFIADGSVLLGRGDIISKEDIEAHPGPYPIYSSSAQGNGKFGEYGKFMFDEELITWSVDGGGYFFYRDKHRYSVTNVCGYMRVKNSKLQPKFVFYSLANQHRYQTFDYTTKAHPSVIKKLYWLPTIGYEQQEKIATILTGIDTAIEKTEALIAKYQQIKAGLMHDLFTRGVLPNGQLRPTREQAPELYQETAIGWIPREWDAKTLRTACDWYSGGTPSKRNEEWWKGTLPWLSPKDMKRFELADTEDHVTRQAAIFGSRIAPKGSVFIVVRGMILAHSFPVAVNSVEFAFNQDVKAVIGRAPLMNRYLSYWFVANTDLFLKKTTESTHGTKRFDLNDLYKIDIGVPTESEQLRVIARLDVVESRIQTEIQRCDKLRRQKSGLMHDLLTGKVPVKVEEPEAVDG